MSVTEKMTEAKMTVAQENEAMIEKINLAAIGKV